MTSQISRRAFIGGAAGAGVLAAAGVTLAALLNREEESPASAASTPAPVQTPTPVPTLAPRAQGSQTIASSQSFSFDTFDAQLTGKSAILEVLGRTHSRLVNWLGGSAGEGTPELHHDLASDWEQPDPTTFLFTIDPAAKWHDVAPLNGRAATAEDVAAHFRRGVAIAEAGNAPLAQRYHQYLGIESIDSPQPGIVRFRTKKADPHFFDLLAGEFALIQASEAVEAFAASWSKLDSDHVVGTGPWTFDWTAEGLGFTAAQSGHGRPALESLRVVEPAAAVQRFIDGQLDEAPAFDRRDRETVRRALTGGEGVDYVRGQWFSRDPVMSTFFVGAAPWNNPHLVNAIGSVIRRNTIVPLFGGRGGLTPVFPRGLSLTQFTEKDMVSMPGFSLPDDARVRWEAAGGPGLGTITVDFPSIFDPLYSASSVIIDALNSTLGPQFRPAVETYTTISKRVSERYYGNGRAAFWFGWGAPLASPNGARYAQETYGSGSPGQAATGGAGARNPLDAAEIAENGYFGIVSWAQQIAEGFRRPGVGGPNPSPFWTQHLDYQRRNA